MTRISISLLTEGELDNQVMRKMLADVGRYEVDTAFVRGGKEKLKPIVPNFNQQSQSGYPYLLLTDLDNDECPPTLIQNWLPHGCHTNFIFRVAVREVEAWLLADREGFANFVKISIAKVPPRPDEIEYPKEVLVNLVRGSRSREIREDIVPEPQSTSKVGKGYNGRLAKFVWNTWNIQAALENSPSLARAIHALDNFTPE